MRRREHPMLPAHSHFHTCESIGESRANHKIGKRKKKKFKSLLHKYKPANQLVSSGEKC